MEVSSSTVTRWIKGTLKLARIDVSIFKGHSTRAASSSKSSKAGLSLSLGLVAQHGRDFIISKL